MHSYKSHVPPHPLCPLISAVTRKSIGFFPPPFFPFPRYYNWSFPRKRDAGVFFTPQRHESNVDLPPFSSPNLPIFTPLDPPPCSRCFVFFSCLWNPFFPLHGTCRPTTILFDFFNWLSPTPVLSGVTRAHSPYMSHSTGISPFLSNACCNAARRALFHFPLLRGVFSLLSFPNPPPGMAVPVPAIRVSSWVWFSPAS